MKKAGNEIVRLLGGREIHPINVKVGGFYRLPEKAQLAKLAEILKQACEDARDTIKWVNGFNFPHLERQYECVALTHPAEYPMALGRIASTAGLDIAISDFDKYFEEMHVPYSHALQSRRKGGGCIWSARWRATT